MPSIVSGFEYDIFISYRHKDNKGDHWVTEFVNALKTELEATFKEDISIYFDENQHDGLLETHDVDESLKEKLKCLIFIPIISHTYCDPKSFAWNNEFMAFKKLASEDQFGLKIKLANGNVASRILPIRIHDLDAEDSLTIENEIGGVLRSIEFIYKETGVNRPLSRADSKNDNQSRLVYQNQVNKVANSIKDIIWGIKKPGTLIQSSIPTINSETVMEKSIIVLPFVNISNDQEQEYFSDGLTEEIIIDLSKVHDLLVISRSSAMTFKSSGKKIKEIAHEINVRYVLEGSVRKSTNNLRITAQLIDAQTDSVVWVEKYTGVLSDVFEIQEKVSRSIVDALKLKLTSSENRLLSERHLDNFAAWDLYIRAKTELIKMTTDGFDKSIKLLKISIDITGPNALLYAGLGYSHWSLANMGGNPAENRFKAQDYITEALKLAPELPEANLVQGCLEMSGGGNLRESIRHYMKVVSVRPNDVEALFWLGVIYGISGKSAKARMISEKISKIDPISVLGTWVLILTEFYAGNFATTRVKINQALKSEPGNLWYTFFTPLIYVLENKHKEAVSFIEQHTAKDAKDYMSVMALLLRAVIVQDIQLFNTLLTDDVKDWAKSDFQYSHSVAMLYSFGGMKKESMDWLDLAVKRKFVNYPFLSAYCPTFSLLHEDPKHTMLLEDVKKQWEDFD